MLPNPIWDAITELCTFFRVICSKVLHISDLEELQKSIVITICKLEKIFPRGFFDSMEHLVIYFVREAILGILKRRIRNKARAEGSIVEAYSVDELSNFCNLYLGRRVQTRLNRESRNFAPEIPCSLKIENRLSIFKVPSQRLFGGKSKVLSGDEMHKIHTYVFDVCAGSSNGFYWLCYIPTGRLCWLKKVQISDSFATTQQQSWINKSLFKFDNSIRETEPSIKDGELDRRREALFASWFNTNVMLASDSSNAHLKSYGGRVTQNSGVCVKGAVSDQHESDYYGLLDEIIEVEYDSDLGRCVVVLFKCTWFDPVQGVKVDKKNKMVDIKHTKKGCLDNPYILALQAKQVYYTPYPCAKDSWAIVKTSPKGVFELEEDISEVKDDDNHVGDDFFQENERLICTTDINHLASFEIWSSFCILVDHVLLFLVIIMSNGWRRSGPRPSHVDISGNGYAGSILLENHHADVNNDEGVAVSEPGVEASNATRGPNTPNPLPEPADRPMISTSADEFDDQKSLGHSITSIIQFRFSEPWATWGCVPRDKQDQMWLRFLEIKHERPIRSTELFTHTHAMKGTKPLDQLLSRSVGSNRAARANGSTGSNRSAGVNRSAGENGSANGSAGENRPAGENKSAGVNGLVGENGSANGSAGANGSVGSVASTSTGVGESNEVGESSGGQTVELRWVNEKSRDHMEKYQGAMVESHGENVESHPHNEIPWNKITPPNQGNTFGAYNASDPVFLLTGTPSIRNASTSHPQIEKVEVLEKSMKDLEQVREKDKELLEEAIEQERKLNEEKFETFKKERNDKLVEALAQLKEQPPTPYSA
ncbi:transposon, En/Spm-like, transposase-associated domain protein [Tanacetum coccineum]|uniref:Transposon, En/Spm-like, transposase-associated domain protein n=1 Tax=Tanacetum coccineum TaxID=301880 RepID=A0ABQ5HZU6_9ASTR